MIFVIKKIFSLAPFALLSLTVMPGSMATRTVLYQNDFETTNILPTRGRCNRPTTFAAENVNQLYGGQGGQVSFGQDNTVETLFNDDFWDTATQTQYSDPFNKGGKHSIGMMCCANDDHLWMDFVVPADVDYFNVEFDMSQIDLNDCGGPFLTAHPGGRI